MQDDSNAPPVIFLGHIDSGLFSNLKLTQANIAFFIDDGESRDSNEAFLFVLLEVGLSSAERIGLIKRARGIHGSVKQQDDHHTQRMTGGPTPLMVRPALKYLM